MPSHPHRYDTLKANADAESVRSRMEDRLVDLYSEGGKLSYESKQAFDRGLPPPHTARLGELQAEIDDIEGQGYWVD